MANEVILSYEALQRNLKQASFKRTPFIFATHVQKNGGLLPDMIEAHACWYYCYCAMQHVNSVKEGATYEGELDTVEMLNNMAMNVAAFYDLPSVSTMLKHMGDVRLEALRCGLGWDERIEQPLKSQFRTRGNG